MLASFLATALIGQLSVPSTMPELELRDTQGKLWKKETLESGRVYLIEFWATWCSTCRAIAPEVKKFVATKEDAKFTYLAVSVDDDLAALRKWAKAEKPSYPVLLDPDFAAMGRWQVKEVPSFFLVKNGQVLWRHTGSLKSGDIESAYEKVK